MQCHFHNAGPELDLDEYLSARPEYKHLGKKIWKGFAMLLTRSFFLQCFDNFSKFWLHFDKLGIFCYILISSVYFDEFSIFTAFSDHEGF